MAKAIVITGRPGIGKTTIFMHAVKALRDKGYVVGGIICPEIRERGVRRGFKIVNLLTGEEEFLALKNASFNGPRVGKYVVNPRAGVFGSRAISEALERADVVAIDEVGPMELRLNDLRLSILKALSQNTKPLLLVVHYRLNDPRILGLLRDAEKYVVTLENRDLLKQKIASRILELVMEASRRR